MKKFIFIFFMLIGGNVFASNINEDTLKRMKEAYSTIDKNIGTSNTEREEAIIGLTREYQEGDKEAVLMAYYTTLENIAKEDDKEDNKIRRFANLIDILTSLISNIPNM